MTLPKDFETYTRALMGDELYDTLCHGLASEPPISIRLNPFKTVTREGIATADVYKRQQHVEAPAQKGVRNHQFDAMMNIPKRLVRDDMDTSDEENNASLSNRLLNHRLRKIIEAERHAIDTRCV